MPAASKSLRAAALVMSMVLTSATLVAAGVAQDQSPLTRLLAGPDEVITEATRSASGSFIFDQANDSETGIASANPADVLEVPDRQTPGSDSADINNQATSPSEADTDADIVADQGSVEVGELDTSGSTQTATINTSTTSTTAAPSRAPQVVAPTTTSAPVRRTPATTTTAAPRAAVQAPRATTTTPTTVPRTTTTTTTTTTTVPPTTAAPAPARGNPLLRVDFSQNSNGSYTLQDAERDFGAIRWAETDRASIASENGNQFLRVFFPEGAVGPHAGGASFMTDFENSIGLHDELYVSYRVRFSDHFDFQRGGKLPGFSAGSAHSGGRVPNGHNGFSTRMMWVEDGAPISYVYHPNQPQQFGHGMPWNTSNFSNSGGWSTVETRVKLNTPGQNNGIIQGWKDGRLVFERYDMRFRDTGDLHIESLFFSTFFGGNDYTWAPDWNVHIDFDDFQVSHFPTTH